MEFEAEAVCQFLESIIGNSAKSRAFGCVRSSE